MVVDEGDRKETSHSTMMMMMLLSPFLINNIFSLNEETTDLLLTKFQFSGGSFQNYREYSETIWTRLILRQLAC